MESFLRELAKQLNSENPAWDSMTLVFPNRRAALYFRKHLSEIITKPHFAPALLTIEDFISEMTTARVPDKLELIHRLHNSYQQIMPEAKGTQRESFDQFYFWGDMLLRDFDETDKYLVNAELLFKDLRNQKELDAGFDYLTDEQREFLVNFWSSFDETLNANKKKFIEVWVKLFELYKTFREQLEREGLAYEGMVHREVAERMNAETMKRNPAGVMFIGFNALTKVEEKIIEHYVELGSKMHWDGDDYYVNNVRQEAGRFIREYQQHPVFKETFSSGFPSNFRTQKTVKLYSSPQPVGQAKLMAQVVDAELKKGMVPEETLIVLPDEKLLMPVLHGIAGSIEKLNVTMGFSLSNTPLFNLIELLVELQIARREDYFNHRQVLSLLGHPYVVAAGAAEANAKRKEILAHNWVHIPESFLATAIPLHRLMFRKSSHVPLAYLSEVITEIGSLENLTDFDREYAIQFIKLLNRMSTLIGNSPTQEVSSKENSQALKSFLRLIKQLVRAEKIPFTGEPLKGLQVMGVLETRNLDFKNVVILSLNEGAFPAFGSKGSYIPYTIRKAYGMPTIEHQDAMYAYLFYRVLQRAENIFLFYNSETDVLGQGEMSRYLQQLIYESGLKPERFALHNKIQPATIHPITIQKDEKILTALAQMNSGNRYFRGISPSALNTYLECRLKFYFNSIAKIREAREVEEDLDARVLGDFFHKVMERFYKQLAEKKKSKLIEASDFDKSEAIFDKLIDQVFSEAYHLDSGKKVIYEGQGLIVREVIWKFIRRIIALDKQRTPFVMEAVELSGLLYNTKIKHSPGFAVVGGTIDRIDRKGDEVRIIDYKTGRDKLDFENVPSLFVRDEKSRKAAFQTLVYALLYKNNKSVSTEGAKIIPGLVNRMNLFDESFKFGLIMGNQPVGDVSGLLPEFENHLKELLEEIFDPEAVFDQTPFVEKCRYCPYLNICYR
ncbi:MAG: PD-(D/E)XK nuclease family protein [Cyclobacteriaceae bacterium]